MTILVQGMQGLGDNLHQRAIIRQLIEREAVFLETPWPSAYHDLVGERLKLIARPFGLRTQKKNAAREAHLYHPREPVKCKTLRVWYTADDVKRSGSVLGAMLKNCDCDTAKADFRLPLQPQWRGRALELMAQWKTLKPIMLYRPLNERTEWKGCPARNPDHTAYAQLFEAIRDRYFVVSVADLQPKVEWLVGTPIKADATFHAGELPFETLAALTERASLVYSSPGFAVILAQAVGTPAVCVFGGYEDSHSFAGGARFSPYLGIDPINPCQCWSHAHACDKRIDLPSALQRLQAFVA